MTKHMKAIELRGETGDIQPEYRNRVYGTHGKVASILLKELHNDLYATICYEDGSYSPAQSPDLLLEVREDDRP